MRKRIAVVVAVLLAAAACTGGSDGPLRGRTIEVVGVWSGEEQRAFEQVLNVFATRTGATVHYTSAGDEIPIMLQTRIQGGNPPNIAVLAQPGLITQFAASGALKPLPDDIKAAVAKSEAPLWQELGSPGGTAYGVYFKVANKSIVWYNKGVFARDQLQPPETWENFLSLVGKIADTGLPPLSVGGADGWVLADWFENIYVRTAGFDNYDKLARHEIPWTDHSVEKALEKLREVFQSRFLEGGALQTEFPNSVINVFSDKPKAAMVFEGDFVGSVINSSTQAKIGTDARSFRFPSIDGSGNVVVTGADAAVAMRDDPATMELLRFLASPDAGTEWAKLGGFLSPNRDVPMDAYPNKEIRDIAQQLLDAGKDIRFGMHDLAPTEFGATKGSGEWKDLQDFLRNPGDIQGTMNRLEADAVRDYGR